MRGIALFTAGLVAGILITQAIAANGERPIKLSHVGISVKNYDQALNYYTKVLGFQEAFTVRNPDGRPYLAYLRISPDTFLEVMPSRPDLPPGFTHFGVEAGDIQATVAQMAARGAKFEPVRTERTKAPLTNASDPEGLRMEILQFAPGSLQFQALHVGK